MQLLWRKHGAKPWMQPGHKDCSVCVGFSLSLALSQSSVGLPSTALKASESMSGGFDKFGSKSGSGIRSFLEFQKNQKTFLSRCSFFSYSKGEFETQLRSEGVSTSRSVACTFFHHPRWTARAAPLALGSVCSLKDQRCGNGVPPWPTVHHERPSWKLV